jgi:hypothetical protein
MLLAGALNLLNKYLKSSVKKSHLKRAYVTSFIGDSSCRIAVVNSVIVDRVSLFSVLDISD